MNEVLSNILISEVSLILPLISIRIIFDYLRNFLFKE